MTSEDIVESVVYSELFWLKEIAYQLAVANERKANADEQKQMERKWRTEMLTKSNLEFREKHLKDYVPKVTKAERGIYD